MIASVLRAVRNGRRTLGYSAFLAVTTAIIVAGAPAASGGALTAFAIGVYALVSSTVALAVAARLRQGRRLPLLAGGAGYLCASLLLISRGDGHLGWALFALLAGTVGMIRCLYPSRPVPHPANSQTEWVTAE